jgi:hypothetical protein
VLLVSLKRPAVVLLGLGLILVMAGSVFLGIGIVSTSGSSPEASQIGIIAGSGGVLVLCFGVLLIKGAKS